MTDLLKTLSPQDYHRQFLLKNIRSDGRKLDEFRAAAVQANVVSSADGSSMVRQGDSLVIASIRAELGRPRQDTPDQGRVSVHVQQSATKWDLSGADGEDIRFNNFSDPIFSADLIQSLLDNSSIIDPKDLCIEKGKLCWVLQCDVVVLDGWASVDACLMAVSTALLSTTLPEVILKPIENVVVDSENLRVEENEDDNDNVLFSPDRIRVDVKKRREVKMSEMRPVASTFLVYRLKDGEKMEMNGEAMEVLVLADPSAEEFKALGVDGELGTVMIVVGEKASICNVHQSGSVVDDALVDKCLSLAESRRHLINRLIN